MWVEWCRTSKTSRRTLILMKRGPRGGALTGINSRLRHIGETKRVWERGRRQSGGTDLVGRGLLRRRAREPSGPSVSCTGDTAEEGGRGARHSCSSRCRGCRRREGRGASSPSPERRMSDSPAHQRFRCAASGTAAGRSNPVPKRNASTWTQELTHLLWLEVPSLTSTCGSSNKTRIRSAASSRVSTAKQDCGACIWFRV